MTSLKGQKVLVTGATGFVGGALVHHLVAEGAEVYALVRRSGRDAYIKDLDQVHLVEGNLKDQSSLELSLKGIDLVYHVAAALGGSYAHQKEVNVTGTSNLVQACLNQGVQRLIHISSIAVYGYQIPATLVTEATPLNPGTVAYNRTKAEAEAVIQASSLDVTVVRPGIIYGPRSNFWTKTAFKFINRPFTLFVGDGSGLAPTIFIDDLCRLLILCATNPAAIGQIFIAVDEPAPTWREFLQAYANLKGGPNRWLALPKWLVSAGAFLIDQIQNRKGDPIEALNLLHYATTKRQFSHQHATQKLGWQPQITIETGTQMCSDYLIKEGLL
ncbi:SDR family NAD(P)-dependent oxidoreductase [Anaerolineales bacterium]